MSRYGCAGETGRNRLGVLRPSAPRRCGADHRQPAREGRQADDPRTDHKRERTEGGPMMKYRSKTKVAGVALAVASITALAACSSSGSSSGGGNTNAGKVTVPGGIGSVPLAASGGKVKAGTITWSLSPGDSPNWIFPVIPSANNSVYNAFTFINEMWRPLYWQVNGTVPEVEQT